MARQSTNTRPEPRFENGHFIPSVPVPDPRNIEDYKWYHGFSTIPKIANNPLESFNHSQFKDPVTQYSIFNSKFTVINDPMIIKHCFVDNRHNYRFSAIRQRLLKSILGDGLITSEGEKWKHARHSMSPMFTPGNVKSFANVMKRTTGHEMGKLFDKQEPVKIAPLMSTLTYLVLSETLFSGALDEAKEQVIENVSTALLYLGRPDPLDILNAPNWMPRLTRMRGTKAVSNLRIMIGQLLQRRKTEKNNGVDLPDDFLTRLLDVGSGEERAFTDTEIEDHLLAFIGAGHETTARAMSWLFYLLSNDTKSRDRFEGEIDKLGMDNIAPEKWIDHLPFAIACFEETMRLFPPAPFIVREAIDDDIKDSITIPSDSILFVNTWQLHRHKTLWEDPEMFKPERFLGKARADIHRFQYLPFGVGERVCIGQRFAMQEAAIMMAVIAKNYRFDYAADEVPWPKLRITIQPENGMPMRITKR